MFLKLFVGLVLAGVVCQALHISNRNPNSGILKTLQTKESATIIISIRDSNTTNIRNQFKTLRFASRVHKLNAFYDLLKNHADEAQANILSFLEKERAEKPIVIRQLWINNEIIVDNADFSLVKKLLALEEVADVREERIFPLGLPEPTLLTEGANAGEQWGIVNVRAPEVWESGYRGQGAVIGTIDTGVRATHEALLDGFRADHGWFDPVEGTAVPSDQNGHGTHTMGIIVGRANGVGVAPDAQWISCRGCSSTSCREAALLACGQFMLCPTDPTGSQSDCSKAPHAVSNSWGGGQGGSWYAVVIDAWVTADIVPFFAVGNSGQGCGSISSPADDDNVLAVAGINANGDVAGNTGPNSAGHIKPNVVAPSDAIVSSFHLSDTAYATLTGNSMAAPHAAGLAALLVSVKNDASYQNVVDAIQGGAQPVPATGVNCGGIDDSDFPNNKAGHGRIDAVASVAIIKDL